MLYWPQPFCGYLLFSLPRHLLLWTLPKSRQPIFGPWIFHYAFLRNLSTISLRWRFFYLDESAWESGKWAEHVVLMLNATLTVRAIQPKSHHKKGWEQFTGAVLNALNKEKEGLVFLLWGRSAQDVGKIIDPSRHHKLMAAHPSPLAGGAYFGSHHFSKTNELLQAQGKEPID